MNVRYALKWLRYQHFWRFVYRPVKPYDTGIYLYLAYLVLENLPTLQSWQKRLLLLAVLCTVTFLFVVLFRSPKTI